MNPGEVLGGFPEEALGGIAKRVPDRTAEEVLGGIPEGAPGVISPGFPKRVLRAIPKVFFF